jgi:hypothetical protein
MMTAMELPKTSLSPPPGPPPDDLGLPEVIWPWVKFIERRRAARKAAAEAKERGEGDACEGRHVDDGD